MVRRLAHEEQGVALVLALIAMLVLGSLTAALAVGVSVNQRTTARATSSNKAFALAEEGIADAEGRLYSAAASGDSVSVPKTGPLSQDGGSIIYEGSLANKQWTLTGTGTYSGVSRVVTVKIGQPDPIIQYDTTPWNYFYVEGGPNCMSIGGSTSTVNIPIYTHGSLCLSGNAVFTGSDLEVGGNLTLSGGNAAVGKSSQPISKLNVVGTCSATDCQGDAAPIFVTSPGRGTTLSPVVTKPVVDFPSYYASTNPGPLHPCGAGSTGATTNLFDNDTTMNNSLASVNLFPIGQAYDCKGTNAELKWDGVNKLTIISLNGQDAQFFFDGSLSLASNTKFTYTGRAQLFFTGRVSMTGQAAICGITNCTGQWDNSANQVFLFVDCWKNSTGTLLSVASGDPYCLDLAGSNTLQANAWVGTDYHAGGNAADVGPVITNTAVIQGNPAQMIPLHNAPANLPGASKSTPQPPSAPQSWSG
jgi:hypothetical protein